MITLTDSVTLKSDGLRGCVVRAPEYLLHLPFLSSLHTTKSTLILMLQDGSPPWLLYSGAHSINIGVAEKMLDSDVHLIYLVNLVECLLNAGYSLVGNDKRYKDLHIFYSFS